MLPNVGIGELVLVVGLLLVVVGPNRLPDVIRAAGKAWRTFQSETAKAKAVLNEALEEPVREIRTSLGEPGRELRDLAEESKRTWSGVVDRPDGDPHDRLRTRNPSPAAATPLPPEAGPPPASPVKAPDPFADAPVVRDYEDT